MTETSEQPYIYTLDPFPQQSPEQTRLYRFYDHLREGRLTTTCCQACGHVPWPPRTICPVCVSDDLAWIDLPTEGTVYAFTVQWNGVPLGYKAPMIFAIVDFDVVRILAGVVDSDPDQIQTGSTVKLVVKEVPHDRVLPFFTLVHDQSPLTMPQAQCSVSLDFINRVGPWPTMTLAVRQGRTLRDLLKTNMIEH